MSLIKLSVMLAMMSYYHEGGDIPPLPIPEIPIAETGISSWYGGGSGDNGLHGKVTATGEVFDPKQQTCASRSIPLNTVVLVEDPSTGNRAWCRVNDRGPYGAMYNGAWVLKLHPSDPGEWRGIMDLSQGTAKALKFDFHSGLNSINIRYFKSADPNPNWQLAALDLEPE